MNSFETVYLQFSPKNLIMVFLFTTIKLNKLFISHKVKYNKNTWLVWKSPTTFDKVFGQ